MKRLRNRKKDHRVAGLWCFLAVCMCGAAGAETVFHVAPGGGRGGDGTAASPFRALEPAMEALAAARSRMPGERCCVWLAGGAYVLERPWSISGGHSGLPGKPVVIRSVPGQRARISLGKQVAASAFGVVREPALLERMVPEARGKVRCLDLASIGLKLAQPKNNFGAHEWLELFAGGSRLPMAVWPNDGYARMGDVLDKGLTRGGSGGAFRVNDPRFVRWQAAVADGLWLRGFWRVPWARQSMRVAKIDAAARTVELQEAIQGGIGSKYGPSHAGKSGEERWQAVNLLEEIDRPGEWSANAATNTLFLWPPGEGELLVCDRREPIVKVDGASDVVLCEVDIEGGFGPGIVVNGGQRVRIAGCRVRNAGERGILINGGTGHVVLSNDISATGLEGIRFTGGQRKTLTPGGHQVVNNHVWGIGVHAPVAAIVAGEGRKSETVGNTVRRNLIHDVPNSGIIFAGNDNRIEDNEICRIGLGSSDLGGVYTNAAWTARGNRIRHNFIHHSPNANAIYLDDGSCGSIIEGNVVWRVGSGGFFGGGHDHRFAGNLLIECPVGIHIDSRGVSRNYDLTNSGFADDLKSVPYQSEPWASRYPALVKILAADTRRPRGVVMEGNLLAGCATPVRMSGKKEDFAGVTVRAGVETKVEPFLDAGWLRLDGKAAVDALVKVPGARGIDLARTGIYQDEYRKQLPQETREALRGMKSGKPGFDSQVDVDASNRR